MQASDFNCNASGSLFLQTPDSKGFFPLTEESMAEPLAFGIYAVRNDINFPLATDTFFFSASSTMTLFPGAVIKFDKYGFKPLAGRIQISGDDLRDRFIVRNRKFELLIEKGNVLIEVTPDEGTFIAVRDETSGIVKTFDRKIIELENASEIHFPLFGREKVSRRLSSFWESAPSSFSALRLPENENLNNVSATGSEDLEAGLISTDTSNLEAFPSEVPASVSRKLVED